MAKREIFTGPVHDWEGSRDTSLTPINLIRLASPETVDTPSNSGKGQKIARCPSCRVALWSNYGGGGDKVRFIRVGSLDEPDRLPPDVHIFTSSKQPWVVLPEGAAAFAEYYDSKALWPQDSLERRKILFG